MADCRFYGDNKTAEEGDKKRRGSLLGLSGSKLHVKAFIAQMATGEGKSIVIAMLAVFMVKLHGMKVPLPSDCPRIALGLPSDCRLIALCVGRLLAYTGARA